MSSDSAQQQPLIIGIDGGGTRTRIAVADTSGEILTSMEGAATALIPGNEAAAADVIQQLVTELLALTDRGESRPAVCVAGIAGAGQERRAQALWSALASRRIAEDIVVLSDAAIAMEDAFGDAAGILLIAGTGSSAFARSPDGSMERCGGWGPNLGDEGSATWTGRRALSAATAAADGREPETALGGALLTALELETMDELIPWAAEASPATIASLAPIVAKVAQSGDLRASSLVALAVEELVLHIRTLAKRCFLDERATMQVAFSGGLLERGSLYRRRLEHRLKSAVPGAIVRQESVDAVRGAITRGRKLLGSW